MIKLIYKFKDISNSKIYEESSVLFITGDIDIINNIVLDELKRKSLNENLGEFSIDDSLANDFNVNINNNDILTSVSVNEFIDMSHTPSIIGKWFCSVDYKTLANNEIELINNYILNPSEYGVLAIISRDYKDYRKYLNNKTIQKSTVCNLIQLSFPNKTGLTWVVKKLFLERGLSVTNPAIDLFIFKMGNSYNEYRDIIEYIAINCNKKEINYEDMKTYLKNIARYDIDDLIIEILKPLKKRGNTVFKVLANVLSESNVKDIINKMRYRIDDYIELRILINKGIIPIKVKYSISEVKEKIGKESRLYKIPNFRFKEMSRIASMTSLRDWVYIKLILDRLNPMSSDIEYERALYDIVHRSRLNVNRLENIVYR